MSPDSLAASHGDANHSRSPSVDRESVSVPRSPADPDRLRIRRYLQQNVGTSLRPDADAVSRMTIQPVRQQPGSNDDHRNTACPRRQLTIFVPPQTSPRRDINATVAAHDRQSRPGGAGLGWCDSAHQTMVPPATRLAGIGSRSFWADQSKRALRQKHWVKRTPFRCSGGGLVAAFKARRQPRSVDHSLTAKFPYFGKPLNATRRRK